MRTPWHVETGPAVSNQILYNPVIRNGQSTVGGPKWTKMDLFRPKWTILVHFGLANAKIQFGIRSF